jgi:hypothetical protein
MSVQEAVFNKNVGSESSPTVGDSAKSLQKYAASAEATPRPQWPPSCYEVFR